MNKQQLIVATSQKNGITQREIRQVIEPMFECILEALQKGERVSIQRFGYFYIKQRNERKSRNPFTGESIIAPAKKVVKFKIAPKIDLK
jgi:nucleoid DNA-binding protein